MLQPLAQVITFQEGELYPKLLLFLSLHMLLVAVSVDPAFWIVFDLTSPLHSSSAGYWHFSLGPVCSHLLVHSSVSVLAPLIQSLHHNFCPNENWRM